MSDLQEIFEHPVVQELAKKAYKDLESEIKLPYILKDKILMSPGVWNNYYYSPETIKRIFEQTKWDDPKVRALFLDHIDDRAAEWIGEVLNPRLVNGNVVADLAILDKPTAIKLAYGAKFGVSPKVIGEADYNRRMYDGHFENFSIVINPAVKTTFLNSEVKIKEIKEGGKNMADKKIELQESEASEQAAEEQAQKAEESKEVQEEKKESVEELAEKVAKIVAEKLSKKEKEELKKKKYPYPEELTEKIKELEEQIEELKKKKKEKYPYPEELSDEVKAELSAYTDFIKEYLKKHPGATLQDAAKAWAEEKVEMNEKTESNAITVEDLKTQVGELVTQKMSEFGIKPIRVASKFIDPSEKGYEEVEIQELDRAIFDMIRQGVGV